MMDTVVRKYRKAVKKHLVCPKEYRQKYLQVLGNNLDACLEENPGASFHDLVTYLGSPQSVAESYLEEIPLDVLNAYLRNRRQKIWIGITSGAVLIILLIVLVAYIGRMHSGFTEETKIIAQAPGVSAPSTISEAMPSKANR
jgi:hypothetical protein